VVLIEAGEEDRNFWIRTPLGLGKLYDNPRYNWMYNTEPEAELGDARIFVPRGKVIGGTGSINGMVYTRGQSEDFDLWRQLGNEGWSYDDVLPYFKKSENNMTHTDEYHGVDGPLVVSDPPRHELVDAFIGSGIQAGYPRNDDFNGTQEEGFGYNQLTISNGRRCSTATAFLKPARARKNLTVITKALATRILFDRTRAVGMEIEQDGVRRVIRARREVILCLGAINSPQLLQVSGVGPAELVGELGIPLVADVPGVGENLQDHFGPAMTYRCTRPVTLGDRANSVVKRTLMGLQYLLFRRGLMTTNGSFGAGLVRTRPELSVSDVRLKLNLWGRSTTGRSVANMGLLPFSAFSVLIALQHPDSRGSVRAKSGDTSVPPKIRYNFFVSEIDRRTCVEAIRIVRKIMALPPVSDFVAAELAPGPEAATDEDLIEFCRKRGRSTSHASCTCKMGVDAMAVVDPRLRVRGVSGLRVIDASVMPRIVGSNPNAAVIMIGEKGSDMILQDARH
jgi:choline dehydrogenase